MLGSFEISRALAAKKTYFSSFFYTTMLWLDVVIFDGTSSLMVQVSRRIQASDGYTFDLTSGFDFTDSKNL